MKKAVLLHGTDGSPDASWLPWLRVELEKKGFNVWVPLLPENHTPNRERYESFLHKSGWDFSENLLIGHSSGATTALNLLMSEWFPKVRKTILVGTFLNERLLPGIEWYEPGQFDDLFPKNGFDTGAIRKKSDHFSFIHGDNDGYCALEDTKEFAEQVNGDLVVVQNGRHLSSNRTELPEILPLLEH